MIRPVPKPKRRKRAERKPGSTLPRPQKKLVAKKRLRPVNRKRRASEFARAYGSRDRVRWVKSLPCVVGVRWCSGPIENAHIENGGKGRKADARFIVPLCRFHHQATHLHGLSFYGFVDWQHEARNVDGHWQQMVAEGTTLEQQQEEKPREPKAHNCETCRRAGFLPHGSDMPVEFGPRPCDTEGR